MIRCRVPARTVAGLGLVLGLLLAVNGCARKDAQVEAVAKMTKEVMSEELTKVSPEEAKQKLESLQKEREKLTDNQKKEVFKEMRKKWKEDAAAYGKMTSQEEKDAWLDKKIDEQEAMRKQFEAIRSLGGATGWGGWGGSSTSGNQGIGTQGSQGGGTNGGATGSQGTGQGASGSGTNQGWQSKTPEERDRRRKQFLDNTSAEERGQWDVLMRDFARRRQERGLSTPGWMGAR